MKILVTGSSGLIGSEVVKYFAQRDNQIIGIDNNMRAYFFGPDGDTRWNQKRLETDFKNFNDFETDIRDRKQVLLFIEIQKPDVIIHTATQPSHGLAAKRPFDDFDVNAVGNFTVTLAFEALSFSFEKQPGKLYNLNSKKLPFGRHAWERNEISFYIPIIEKFGYKIK